MTTNATTLVAIFAFTLGISIHASAQNAPVEVSVTYPTATKNYETLLLSGSVESAQDAMLSPLESGMVAELLVEVGDEVKQGQALLSLDNKLGVLAVRQAQAELKAAQVSLTDAKSLKLLWGFSVSLDDCCLYNGVFGKPLNL